MSPEEFLNSLERRGFTITLHKRGGFIIVPHAQLSADDRANLKQGAAALERLLRQRSAITDLAADQHLSLGDTEAIQQTLKTFDRSTLLNIRPGDASRRDPEQASLLADATALARPPAAPEAKQMPAVETTALDTISTVESPDTLDACPPGTEATDFSSAQTLAPGVVTSAPPRPDEAVRQLMVSELASCNQLEISVDEVLSETAIVDTSFEPAIGHAPDLSTRSGSEIAPEVTSRSTSSPREVVLVVDPAPDTDAPGEPDEAEKVTAVTRESSAQLSNDKSRRVLLWVTVDRVRQGGRPALLVKLSPSPSTNPDVVGFTVEEHSHSYRLIAGPCRLTRSGYRLVRRADGLRLAIGWWR